jgi:hypothetical protein
VRPDPTVETLPLRDGEIVSTVENAGLGHFVAGFTLASPHADFGGFSGLVVEDETLLAVSDRGSLWLARLVRDEDGRVRDIVDWTVHALRDRPAGRAARFDVEAVARGPGDELLLSLERQRSLVTLERSTLRPLRREPWPEPLRTAPFNEGIEALAVLPGGDRVAISEGLARGPDRYAGALFGPDRSSSLTFGTEPGFRVTDLAVADDTLYVLQRSVGLIGGLRAVVAAVPLPEITGVPSGAIVTGSVVARIDASLIGANFEGLAAVPHAGGQDLYLLSDDNFGELLSTVFLQVRLPPDRPAQ